MLERQGDIWSVNADAIVVPTNRQVNNKGLAVMGAGVALQAKERYPQLPKVYGTALQRQYFLGDMDHDGFFIWNAPDTDIVCFATKNNWRDSADLGLILSNVRQLQRAGVINEHWEHIALPRVGAGLGNLQWDRVRSLLKPYLDDRFVVYTP